MAREHIIAGEREEILVVSTVALQMLKVSETCQVLMELLEAETAGHLPRAA